MAVKGFLLAITIRIDDSTPTITNPEMCNTHFPANLVPGTLTALW
jgi:hypothetical protein